MKEKIYLMLKFIFGSIFILIISFIMLFGQMIYAAEIDSSSTIMYELTADPSFNRENYPGNATDYSIQVFQIGESENKDLYLYCYQPSHNSIDLIATSVSIYYGFTHNGIFPNGGIKIYELELVSTSGVFDKYLVKNFKEQTNSNNDGARYYNIVEIYRKFNEVIDTSIEYGERNEIAYSVGQQWYAHDVNNSVVYEMATFETMRIEIVFHDTAYFPNGFTMGNIAGIYESCDGWYLCFNVPDYVIKHIYDADVSFKLRTRTENWAAFVGSSFTYGDWENKTMTLTDEDIMYYKGSGLRGRTYQWNRIMSSNDFIDAVADNHRYMDSDTLNVIRDSQWVFSYYETTNRFISYEGGYSRYDYEVSGTTILRLHFMDVNHRVYNLGVVMDKTTPDNNPGITGSLKSIKEIFSEVGDFMQKILMIILIVVLVLIFIFFTNLLIPLINVLKFILKAIIYVITLPFKIIFRRKK